MFTILFSASDIALLIARVIFGVIFVVYGMSKLKMRAETAKNFNAMGFRPGAFWGTAVALLEFFGGLAILVGFYVQIIALAIAGQMVIATLWKIKNKQKLMKGFDFDLALVAIGLLLATSGAGLYALDSIFIGSPF